MRFQILLLTSCCAVFFGFGKAGRDAKAAAIGVPTACPQWQCKTVQAIWFANANVATAFFVSGTNGATSSSDGWQSIFSQTSVEQLPLQAQNGLYDAYDYPSCNPMCGKDQNGNWQAPQEVSPTGQQGQASAINLPRKPCTATQGGAAGPQINPPNNTNTGTPPGN